MASITGACWAAATRFGSHDANIRSVVSSSITRRTTQDSPYPRLRRRRASHSQTHAPGVMSSRGRAGVEYQRAHIEKPFRAVGTGLPHPTPPLQPRRAPGSTNRAASRRQRLLCQRSQQHGTWTRLQVRAMSNVKERGGGGSDHATRPTRARHAWC